MKSILDSGFRRNDKIAGFMQLCKDLERSWQAWRRSLDGDKLNLKDEG
jgi:hypothetical protein